MDVRRVDDVAAARRMERLEATAAEQAGMIDYLACMADIELPEGGGERIGGPDDQ